MKNIHVLPTDKPTYLYKFEGKLYLSEKFEKADKFWNNQNIYITNDEEIKEGDYFLYDETEIRYKTNGTEYHGRDLCHISGNRRYPVNKSKKIILTTDQDLIGVQTIDDEFLEWFVKNPSCEEVEVSYEVLKPFESENKGYLIHCPDNEPLEEPKQENCCTPIGQIKRYVDCKGCDRKPKQETLEEPTMIDDWLNEYGDPEIYKKVEKQLELEEAAERYSLELLEAKTIQHHEKTWIKSMFIHIAKWQQERMYSEEEVLNLLYERESELNTHNSIFDYQDAKEWFEQFKKK